MYNFTNTQLTIYAEKSVNCIVSLNKGSNARKVVSEVYAFFVLQCSVLSLGRKVNTRRMPQPHMGSIFTFKKSMKYSGHRKLIHEFSKLSKVNAFILIGY